MSDRATETIRIAVCVDPFTGGEVTEHRVARSRAEGQLAIGYLLDAIDFTVPIGCEAAVSLESRTDGGLPVEVEDWDTTIPGEDEAIVVVVLPANGGGGKRKSPFRTILAVVAIALSFAAPPGSFLAGAIFKGFSLTWGQAIGFGLNLIGGLLAPSSQPRLSQQSGRSQGAVSTPSYAFSGQSNRLNPYGAIPRAFGRIRWTPPLGARTYTEIIGDDQFVRIVLDLGTGPLQIEDWEIGTTPIEAFDDVEIEVRQGFDDDEPLSLFPVITHEDTFSIELKQATGWVTRRSRPDADELSIDITLPRGLAYYNDSGGISAVSLEFEVEYSPAGADTWSPVPWEATTTPGFEVDGKLTISTVSTSAVRRGGRWKVTNGEYDVRWRRLTADLGIRYLQDSFVTALRTYTYGDPMPGTGAKAAFRIKATGQLNGQLDPITVLTTSIVPVFDGMDWSEQPSRNPAWHYIQALRGPECLEPLADDRFHFDAFYDWAADNDLHGRTFDMVYDSFTTTFQVLRDIAEAGRADFGMKGTLYSIVREIPQVTYKQAFGPNNAWGFGSDYVYPDRPHGYRVLFRNADKNWQEDERVVPATGYTVESATRLSTLELVGLTDTENAFKEAKFREAVSTLRPHTHHFNTFGDHVVCQRGDLVSVAFPVTGFGLGDGYIVDADTASALLTEPMPMLAGASYRLRIRYTGQASIKAFDLTPVAVDGYYDLVEFATALDAEDVPELDDYVQFGETSLVAADMVVLRIKKRPNHEATVYVANAAPELHDIDGQDVPAYDSQITTQTPVAQQRPAKPVFGTPRSDETVLEELPGGVLVPRIVVPLQPRGGTGPAASTIQVQAKRADSLTWQIRPSIDAYATEIVVDQVTQGLGYGVRARTVTADGRASDWTVIENHVVVGQSSRPTDPAGLMVERLPSGSLRYRVVYPDPPTDHRGFLYRWALDAALNWDSAIPAHTNVIESLNFEAFAFADRSFTMMVRAIDKAGNLSDGLSYAIVDLGDHVSERLVDSHDFAGGGFAGTITNGSIIDGVLFADSAGELFASPSQPVFTTPGQITFDTFEILGYVERFTVARKGFLNIVADYDGPATFTYAIHGTERLFNDPSESLFDDPSDALFADAAQIAFQGPFEVTKGAVVDLTLSIGGGHVQGAVRSLRIDIDVPVVTEYLDDVSIDAAGTRLPTNRSWDEIVKVSLTLQDGEALDAVTARIVDKDVSGPLTHCFDIANQATDGLVDVTIQGVAA